MGPAHTLCPPGRDSSLNSRILNLPTTKALHESSTVDRSAKVGFQSQFPDSIRLGYFRRKTFFDLSHRHGPFGLTRVKGFLRPFSAEFACPDRAVVTEGSFSSYGTGHGTRTIGDNATRRTAGPPITTSYDRATIRLV